MAIVTWFTYREMLRTIGLPNTFVVIGEAEIDLDKAIEMATHFAFNEFCAHTAKTLEFIYDNTITNPVDDEPYNLSEDTVYRLPALAYPNPRTIKAKSWVYIEDVLVDKSLYYWSEGYRDIVWIAPPVKDFEIRYYAYYDLPINGTETDELLVDIPDWALGIVRHRIVSHILSMSSIETADIRQWNTRRDSGNPDNNPLADRMMASEKMYKILIDAVPSQNQNEVL